MNKLCLRSTRDCIRLVVLPKPREMNFFIRLALVICTTIIMISLIYQDFGERKKVRMVKQPDYGYIKALIWNETNRKLQEIFDDLGEDTLPGEGDVKETVVLGNTSLKGAPVLNVDISKISAVPLAKIQCGNSVLKPGHRVPNIIHYIWFGIFEMTNVQYYAIRSAALIQKPYLILFHTDLGEPIGPYWMRLKAEVPCIRRALLIPQEKIRGRKIMRVEHKADVARMMILLKYGGIYSDVNVVFVRPVDDLMKYSVVLGKEEDVSYGNSFILSERNASFVQIWMKSYVNFNHEKWSEHSTGMPLLLHKWFPEIELHVEEYSLMRPNYIDGPDWLTQKNWDLRHNYCVHLYINEPVTRDAVTPFLKLPESELITLDNTIGQLIRISLFGTPYLEMDSLDIALLNAHTPIACGSERMNAGRKDNMIPNELHYIWNEEHIRYQHYLGVRSAVSILRPTAVYIHLLSEKDPFYHSYLQILREIPCLRLIQEKEVESRLSATLSVLYEYGGIVLDFNTTILKPFTDLLSHEFVIGEHGMDFDYSIVMAKPQSPIVMDWINNLERTESPDEALRRALLKSETDVFITNTMVAVPPSDWFEQKNHTFPSSRAISFKQSRLNRLDEDLHEKNTIQEDNFVGNLAKKLLL